MPGRRRLTGPLQTACLEAADDAVRSAEEAGTLAPGDVIGASHVAALAAADVVLRWLIGAVGKELGDVY